MDQEKKLEQTENVIYEAFFFLHICMKGHVSCSLKQLP